MTECVACSKCLTLHIELNEEDEDTNMGGSSMDREVDDDVQLQCGCHFHWFVHRQSSFVPQSDTRIIIGNAYLMPIP